MNITEPISEKGSLKRIIEGEFRGDLSDWRYLETTKPNPNGGNAVSTFKQLVDGSVERTDPQGMVWAPSRVTLFIPDHGVLKRSRQSFPPALRKGEQSYIDFISDYNADQDKSILAVAHGSREWIMDIKDMEGFECGHLIFIHRKNRVEIVEDFWMLVSRRPSIGGRPVGINYLLKRQEFERNMNYVFSDRIIRIGNPITAIYHRSED